MIDRPQSLIPALDKVASDVADATQRTNDAPVRYAKSLKRSAS